MKSLSSPKLHLNDYKGGGVYVSVVPVSMSADRLYQIGTEFGLDLPKDKLHVTVMYSRTPPKVVDPTPGFKVARALVKGVEVFEGHDKANYLTLQIESPALHNLHQVWTKKGACHSYNPYNPHVTLHKGIEVTPELNRRIQAFNEALAESPIPLVFRNEQISALKDD